MQNQYEENLQQYLANISSVPEIIPDIGNIIAEYAGGECAAYTNGGGKCWSYNINEQNFDCNQYCIDNIDQWMYGLIKQIAENKENIDNYIISVAHHNDVNDIKVVNLEKTITTDTSQNLPSNNLQSISRIARISNVFSKLFSKSQNVSKQSESTKSTIKYNTMLKINFNTSPYIKHIVVDTKLVDITFLKEIQPTIQDILNRSNLVSHDLATYSKTYTSSFYSHRKNPEITYRIYLKNSQQYDVFYDHVFLSILDLSGMFIHGKITCEYKITMDKLNDDTLNKLLNSLDINEELTPLIDDGDEKGEKIHSNTRVYKYTGYDQRELIQLKRNFTTQKSINKTFNDVYLFGIRNVIDIGEAQLKITTTKEYLDQIVVEYYKVDFTSKIEFVV